MLYLFYTMTGKTDGSHPYTTIGFMQLASYPTLCVARTLEYQATDMSMVSMIYFSICLYVFLYVYLYEYLYILRCTILSMVSMYTSCVVILYVYCIFLYVFVLHCTLVLYYTYKYTDIRDIILCNLFIILSSYYIPHTLKSILHTYIPYTLYLCIYIYVYIYIYIYTIHYM